MKRSWLSSLGLLDTHRRAIGGAVVALLLANAVVAARHVQPKSSNVAGLRVSEAGPGNPSPALSGPGSVKPSGPGAAAAVKRSTGVNPGGLIGRYIPGVGTIPRGITGSKVRVVYYWKGDQVMGSSQYLNSTNRQGDLDEGEAFRKLVDYINIHANGGATFMGFPFNLHGRTLEPHVIATGKSDWSEVAFAEAAANIIALDPFAAISSHGSLSVDICPRMAAAGIHNFGTYDLGSKQGTLEKRTKGYCYAQATSFEAQIEHSVAYLAKQAATEKHTDPTTGLQSPRRYGVLYARYTGLKDVVGSIVARLRSAGVNIPNGAVQSVSPSLTDSQVEAPGVVYEFERLGVNTVITPDAGAPLNVTNAATAQKYFPDWFVWPCSGQDSTGMVRLYNRDQWAHAKGLTCYDPEFNADLTNDALAKKTEWYRQYQSVAHGKEPPAPTAIVYQSLLPLLVGLTNAGRDITVERFRAGIKSLKPYRYSAVLGRAGAKPYNMLISIGHPDGSMVGDVARLRWDPNAEHEDGITGNYVYPPPQIRYTRGAVY